MWLKGLLYSILCDAEDVDEALQEVCIRVLEKVHTLRDPECFKSWLATVGRHTALSLRGRRKQKTVSLDELLAVHQPPDKDKDVADKMALREQHEQVLEAVKRLPEKYREVFVLKYIKDMSYAEIAEILDLPVTTVQIRLVRSRRMIYNRLTGKPTDKVPRT